MVNESACKTFVTQLECQQLHEKVDERMDDHEDRLNKKDVSDAKRDGVSEVQTKLLWGIFAVGAGSFFVNLFAPVIFR